MEIVALDTMEQGAIWVAVDAAFPENQLVIISSCFAATSSPSCDTTWSVLNFLKECGAFWEVVVELIILKCLRFHLSEILALNILFLLWINWWVKEGIGVTQVAQMAR